MNVHDVGESSLELPLPWDRIAAVPFHATTPLAETVQTLAREQGTHAAHDADYQWLVAALGSLEQARKDHSLSLNLQTRMHERDVQEQQALQRENARRAADGMSALKALADAQPDDQPDVVLAEAARIAAMLTQNISPAPLTASDSPGTRTQPSRNP